MTRLLTPIDYEKLSDDLFYLGNKMILRLNVILAKKTKDDSRRYFHNEYMYASKYLGNQKVVTMRRGFEYYLSIDKTDIYEHSIMIRIQNIMLLKIKMKEVSKWFSDGETFGMKKGKLIIRGRPSTITVTGLPGGKMLSFDPIVIEWENTGDQQPGVRMTLNNSDIYTDISIDNFYGFFYLIDTINMYESAQLMVNYLGRPNFGENLTEFENDYSLLEEPKEPDTIKAKEGRKPKNLKGKSFFDKIDDIL